MRTIYSMLYISNPDLFKVAKIEMRGSGKSMQRLIILARPQAGTLAYNSKADAIKAARKLNRESEYTRALVYELTLL